MLKYLKKAGKCLETILISPAIALNYAVVKTYKSLKRLYHALICQSSYKSNLLSFLRIISTGVGGFYGAKGGILLGALLGSMAFPGIGTLVGSIVGGILGGVYGVGLGAFLGKQMIRGINWVKSKYADYCSHKLSLINQTKLPLINKTNPNKYLPEKPYVKEEYKEEYFVNAERQVTFSTIPILAIMKKIYEEKQKNKKSISLLGSICSWLASEKDMDLRQQNEKYNQVLKKLRKGEVEFKDAMATATTPLEIKLLAIKLRGRQIKSQLLITSIGIFTATVNVRTNNKYECDSFNLDQEFRRGRR